MRYKPFLTCLQWSIFSLKKSEIIKEWIGWCPRLFLSTSSAQHPFPIISNNPVSWSHILGAYNPGSLWNGSAWHHPHLATFHSFLLSRQSSALLGNDKYPTKGYQDFSVQVSLMLGHIQLGIWMAHVFLNLKGTSFPMSPERKAAEMVGCYFL